MTSTRKLLEILNDQFDESVGVRKMDLKPVLSPVASQKDAGRRPIRQFGRISIDQVIPDPDQPRQQFDPDAVERLSKSITDKGQLAPIRVRWSEGSQKWGIIAGERRWRATRQAGLTTIDCHFHEGELSHSEILEQQIIENCLREDRALPAGVQKRRLSLLAWGAGIFGNRLKGRQTFRRQIARRLRVDRRDSGADPAPCRRSCG